MKPTAGRANAGYLLALDVGTTTVRAILFDLDGAPVGEAYREPHALHPQPSWAEMPPEVWWEYTVAVIREALERSGVPGEAVLAVGLSGLMHTLIPIDREGRPLANAMLWMDQRCRPQAEWLQREHGDTFRQYTGREAVATTWSAPKMRWLSESQPGLMRRAWAFLLVKDFVRFRLTGELASNASDARGTLLFDERKGDWALPLLELVGLRREQMAPILDPWAVAGRVTPAAATATGLAAGTPVVTGGDDTNCTRMGANAMAPGRTCLYLGTAAWIAASRSDRTYFGATATTGAALKWLTGLLGPAEGASYGALVAEAERVGAGAGGLLFLPHLMGERGPVPSPQAKGAFFGLTLAHGRAEMARALLEGCAFQLRAILDNLSTEVREMVVVGGGAKGALWRQIIADVTGVPLQVPRALEAGALGAAMLAGVGVGVYPSVEAAGERLVRIVERHEPGQDRALYERIYVIFRELEERLAPLYGRLPVVLD